MKLNEVKQIIEFKKKSIIRIEKRKEWFCGSINRYFKYIQLLDCNDFKNHGGQQIELYLKNPITNLGPSDRIEGIIFLTRHVASISFRDLYFLYKIRWEM